MNRETAIKMALDMVLKPTATHHGSSRWGELRRCPRGHHLRYVEGVRLVKTPEHFLTGQLLHAGLAYAGLGEMWGFRWKLSDILNEVRKRELFEEDIVAEVEKLLKAYWFTYGTENAGYGKNVHLSEVEWFVASKKLDMRYTGRVDALLLAKEKKSKKERLIIVDHKTRSRDYPQKTSEEELIRRFATKPQFLGLAYCVREIEGELPCFMMNLIVKTVIPKFRRFIWEFTHEELDRWAEAQNATSGTLDSNWMNYSECAPEIGKPCWAFDWCHGDEESREEHYYVVPQKSLVKKNKKKSKRRKNVKGKKKKSRSKAA